MTMSESDAADGHDGPSESDEARPVGPSTRRFTQEDFHALAAANAASTAPLARIANNVSGFSARVQDLQKTVRAALALPKITLMSTVVMPKIVFPMPDMSRLVTIPNDFLAPLMEQLSAVATALESLPVKALREVGPDNWQGLTDAELTELPELAERGIPISWVPRTAVVRELLTTEPSYPQWITVVTARQDAIVEDCDAALDSVDSGERSELGQFLRAALRAFQEGHHAAAQALAMNVLDTGLRAMFPPDAELVGLDGKRPRGVYKRFSVTVEQMDERGRLLLAPWLIAHRPALVALQEFWPEKGDAVPSAANRHATAHAVGEVQYTEGNALLVLMLSTTILREAHHWDERLSMFGDEDDQQPAG